MQRNRRAYCLFCPSAEAAVGCNSSRRGPKTESKLFFAAKTLKLRCGSRPNFMFFSFYRIIFILHHIFVIMFDIFWHVLWQSLLHPLPGAGLMIHFLSHHLYTAERLGFRYSRIQNFQNFVGGVDDLSGSSISSPHCATCFSHNASLDLDLTPSSTSSPASMNASEVGGREGGPNCFAEDSPPPV